jgi:dTMP kinase
MVGKADKKRGKFIVIEGLDGSGKTTQAKNISAKLSARGHKVHSTCEPTHFKAGDYARSIISNSLRRDMHLQAALFLADRLEHITHPSLGLESQLASGATVICDRYYYSSFAYQGGEVDMQWVIDINLKCPRMLRPDLCLFLDVPPETCMNRLLASRSKLELYEGDTIGLQKIRANFFKVFETLKSTDNVKIIDANINADAITEACMTEILNIIN